MKLIIQIPCYNESLTLPATLADLPRKLPDIDVIQVLVIDDGSTDGTAEVARRNGVEHLVRFPANRGLAAAFAAGLDAAVKLGADVIVNTDADNQYQGQDIGRLVEPIVQGRSDMVVGQRTGDGILEFSPLKRRLQGLGSWVVRQLSGTSVPDATSGFRAFSRDAALRLNVFTDFTYTLETIIQAGKKNLAVAAVKVQTNRSTRKSRLFRNIPEYLLRSSVTLMRIYALYQPFKVFAIVAAVFFTVGGIGVARFLLDFLGGGGTGKIQSLILSGAMIGMGFQSFLIAIVADLIGSNRRLLEDLSYRIRSIEASSREAGRSSPRGPGTTDPD